MLRQWTAVGVLSIPLLLSSPGPTFLEPAAAPRVAASHLYRPPSDTLRTSATRRSPLILSLPAELDDARVDRYSVLQGPALCGVAGRSFTWITVGSDPGTYDVRLEAHHPDAPSDTLVVRIALQS